MRRLLTCLSLLILVQGCGSEVERTTGTVSGSAGWTGTWPSTGTMMLVLFVTPPWDPDFQPGPPAAFRLLTRPDSGTVEFELDHLAFGTYDALMISWQDPDDEDPSTRDHPVSVYGTTVNALDQATPLVLSKENPDITGLVMPPFVLHESAEDMRSNYPSVP